MPHGIDPFCCSARPCFPTAGGRRLLTLNGVDEKIPVSRRRVSALKKALGL